MKISEALTLVREKIFKPENWCQGSLFKDKDGNCVISGSENITQYCIIGSIKTLEDLELESKCRTYLDSILFYIGYRGYNPLPFYNDTNDHSGILFLIDKAIKLAKEDEIQNESL